MSEQTWKPMFRAPESTITKVLRSASFNASRERAHEIMDDTAALRQLAQAVRSLNYTNAPLSAIADRVAAGYRLLIARADALETSDGGTTTSTSPGGSARERLIVAALHYLVTPIDVVPDFRVGGYLDDVLLLSWVFGAAVAELDPYLEDESGSDIEG